MNDAEPTIVRPELVAAKMSSRHEQSEFRAAVQAEPRLVELAWFLQWQSIQPCGLAQFSADFLEFASDRIGTNEMHRLGKTDEPYSLRERQDMIASFPDPPSWQSRGPDKAASILSEFDCDMRGERDCAFRNDRACPDLSFVNQQNHSYFCDTCRRYALARLPHTLARFCSEQDATLPDAWYFQDLQGALIEYMDLHAARARQSIALTAVARDIFDALDFAWSEKAMVEITGDSRFGKTEAVKAWCLAYPGRARLVKTPCDNADRSLLEAIATAAGVEVTLQTGLRELKAKLEFVLKHSRLMFVFDEAAWLIPQKFGRNTNPVRLNYIRSQLLDNGCPVALVVTPQFFAPSAHRFEKTTGFNMAQWRGRIMRSVTLPNELAESDLLAVIKIHCPDLKEAFARRIMAAALISESFLSAVEKIVRNARAVAHKNGRAQIELADLESGIALAGLRVPSVLPRAHAAPAAPAGVRPAPAPQPQNPRTAAAPASALAHRPPPAGGPAAPALPMTGSRQTEPLETVN